MHARRQTKGVCIEHGVVWVEEVVHTVENSTYLAGLGRGDGVRGGEGRVLCRRHGRLHALALHRLRRGEALRIWTGPSGLVAGFFLVYHIGLLIVLLLCTHGFSLGRTKLYA